MKFDELRSKVFSYLQKNYQKLSVKYSGYKN